MQVTIPILILIGVLVFAISRAIDYVSHDDWYEEEDK